MNSSFLCVIVIGLVFQVFAQVNVHSQLWQEILDENNEENVHEFHSQSLNDLFEDKYEENKGDFQSQIWLENFEEKNVENKVGFHSQLFPENLEENNEENIKTTTYQMDEPNAKNVFVDGFNPPRMRSAKIYVYLVCAEKTEISSETILSIKKGDWKVDDPKAKPWVQCVLIESDLMTDQSVFRLDVAFKDLSDIEKETLEENIDKCLPTKAMPPVDIAWEFAKCFQAADPRNSLF